MTRKIWVYDLQVVGKKIPDTIKPRIRQHILMHAQKHYTGNYNRSEVRSNHWISNILTPSYEDFKCSLHPVIKNFNRQSFGQIDRGGLRN